MNYRNDVLYNDCRIQNALLSALSLHYVPIRGIDAIDYCGSNTAATVAGKQHTHAGVTANATATAAAEVIVVVIAVSVTVIAGGDANFHSTVVFGRRRTD
jgi:hypothetical protein